MLLCVLALALVLGVSPARGAVAPRSPFAGTALWINRVPAQSAPQTLAAQAGALGLHTLFVKAGDGSTPDPQFSPALLSGLAASGISVCGWTFAYGQNPLAEAAVAVAAVRNGAKCLVIDAEGQYDGLYGPAQLFIHTLRRQLGSRFPIGLAGQAEIAQHPSFPYSVFLGPGGFDADLPQMYWLDFGVSVDSAYAATIAVNSVYQRPIAPVGQLFGAPPSSDLLRFRSLASAYSTIGLSFYDLEAAVPDALAALLAPLERSPQRALSIPTLRPGADSDEVLWAQELLNAAGAKLPIGGFYGAQTARAVGRFQSRHRLHVSGLLTSATWKALMRFRAREPSWAKGPPASAR